jgi:hypothetical protein
MVLPVRGGTGRLRNDPLPVPLLRLIGAAEHERSGFGSDLPSGRQNAYTF